MTDFWILSAGLLALAAYFLLAPLWRFKHRHNPDQALSRKEQNIQIYRDRVSDLENDLELQKISQEVFDFQIQELKADLLQDIESVDSNANANPEASDSERVGLSLPLLLCVGFVLLTIASSVVLYTQWGEYELASQREAFKLSPEEVAAVQAAAERGDINTLLEQLQSKLETQPKNIEGWSLLGRSAMNAERYDVAAKAFATLSELFPQDSAPRASVLGLLAQSYYFGQNQGMTPEVKSAIDAALAVNPNETNTLGLLAIDAFDRGDLRGAKKNWEQLLSVSPEHTSREAILAGIARVNSMLGEEDNEVMSAAAKAHAGIMNAPSDRQADTQVGIEVTVRLSDALRSQTQPTDTVFIIARSDQPVPLAVSRHRVSDLPVTVRLDDSKSMAPIAKLSMVETASVFARVSKSGQPIAAPGDLQGSVDNIPTQTNQSIEVTIDQSL